ncbi:YkvI family membrane protein [Corynebacterium yonathiae]|uniref:Amino acid permease n=1 Tax=Corynebacterium yonathiae TaxID=2913504 RepID=A0A9X3RLM3_9CORY|nr:MULTISPECIES: hypothetical protein [Corynebacterium]MCZ9296540.1 hypothetical protein [Corynebacterium yonathiae]MDK2583417.1 hypothetical protein [Corynebacterium sp. BWA136]
MKKVFLLALAYFSSVVGAGFASGQELLQYFTAFGIWGIVGASVGLILAPLTIMIAMQYGSYFQATSHGRVFSSIASKPVARFVDYAIIFTQFCHTFVMLSGGGANLHQQWGLQPWVGSALMAVLVLIVGSMNVGKVTSVLGAITPFVLILLLLAVGAAFIDPPSGLQQAHDFATANVDSPLPFWWVAALNYLGLALMASTAMSIVMGADTLNSKQAGRGGFFGGLLFSGMLVLLVIALLLSVEDVWDADLPTLAMLNEIHPWLGTAAAVFIYLMIFSTAISNFYGMARRLSARRPHRYMPILVASVVIAFILSFVPFGTLVGIVFPVLGYIGIIVIGLLIYTWLRRGRGIVSAESRRRDKIRALILRMIDPKQKFTTADQSQLSREVYNSNLSGAHLRNELAGDVIAELDSEDDSSFHAEDYQLEEDWKKLDATHPAAEKLRDPDAEHFNVRKNDHDR